MRPCGRFVAPPSEAYPPTMLTRGNPLSRTFWLPLTTPGTPGKIVAALKPASCTLKSVLFRENPARVSRKNVGEKVCVSVSARFCEPGGLLVPLLGRLLELRVVPPNQM